MTREDIRHRLGTRTLLDVALAVHANKTGAAEGDPKDHEEMAQLLRDALATWQQGTDGYMAFDEAARSLLRTAMNETAWTSAYDTPMA